MSTELQCWADSSACLLPGHFSPTLNLHNVCGTMKGVRRTVTQAEGGEQGDPLMPFLFSIGIQGVLEEVATQLEDGEQLCVSGRRVFAVPTRTCVASVQGA